MVAFYLGGKYEERHQIKDMAHKLVEMGYEWTCDWTKHWDLTFAQFYAQEDIKGVLDADFVIFKKDNDHKYKGTWVEMGAALASGKPVYIVGHAGDSCLFIKHPLVEQFENFNDLFEYINYRWDV
uniref:Putative nucleoside deoxyribosyltransferase n=1 Tax=viral metagenome TaxID=1070528 RepID=A0A6M3K5D4_9ZZZZ